MTIQGVEPKNQSEGVPPRLVYWGVFVGLFLILLGIGLLYVGRGSLLSSLMTCVGFGIMLASFGSKASGKWAGWTVTGAGATAIALFLVLQYYTPALSSNVYKKGQLRGDLSKIADLRIIDELPMYQYRDRTTSSFRFVLLERKLRSPRLSVQVDTNEKGAGREFFELIGNGQAIQRRYLSEDIDRDRVIQWTFDFDKRVIKDGDDIIFSEPDSLQHLPRSPGDLSSLRFKIQIGNAFAQQLQIESQSTAITDLIAKLKSDDTSVRRSARDDLATRGPQDAGAMISALRTSPSDYRVRLGVVYALSEMLRRSPDERTAISSALKDVDFSILVDAASDDDKTIRLQAAQFLYLLRDPRAVPASVEAGRSVREEGKATNQLIIIRQSGQSLPESVKQKIFDSLKAGPGPNNEIFRSIDNASELFVFSHTDRRAPTPKGPQE
jgi:hypothetical protein